MITVDDLQQILFSGGDVVGPDGKKIGSAGQLFLDAATGDPAWVTVSTGLFGTSESFVPLAGAQVSGDVLRVAHDKSQVRHAPRIEGSGAALSPAEERELYRHYGLLHDDVADDDPTRAGADRRTDAGAADAGRTDPDGDAPGPEFLPPPIRPIGTPAAPPGVPPLAPPGTPSATEGSVHLGSGAHGLAAGSAGAAAPAADTTSIHSATGGPAAVRPGAAGGVDETAAAHGAAGVRDADGVDAGGASAVAPLAAASTSGAARDAGMVLRAEQAKVIGTERVPTERVRLRRYTVTEQREITVPVTREEFRVEYEPADGSAPLTPTDQPADGAEARPERADGDRDGR